jgi:hypothetical protein
MATITDESQKQNAADFEAAYGEEVQKPVVSDDEAFGLVPDEAPGTATPTGTPAVAVDLDKGAAGADAGEQGGAAAAPGGAAAGEEGGAAAAAPALDVDKETQRLKSWEGRLKAQQAEIDRAKAEAAAAADRGTDGGTGTGAEEDKGGKDDKAGQGGDDAYKAAMEALEADFGPEFVQLLTTVVTGLAARTATEHAAPYRKDIDAIIAEITNDRERAHFEKIADAHPDFLEVSESDAFKAWIAGLADPDKTETERIAASGNAKEIIAMLKRYKATLATKDADSAELDAAMDQAEGVRSTGGLKLPDTPASNNDYKSAWEEF